MKKDKKILIYGAGHNCELFMRFAHDCDFEIVGVIDTYKFGEYYHEHLVISPEEITNISYDEIFILVSNYENEILENLEKKYKVNRSNIRNISYINECYMLGDFKDKNIVFITDNTDYLNISYEQLEICDNILFTSLLPTNYKFEIIEKNNMFHGWIIVRSHYFEIIDPHLEEIRRKYPQSTIILLLSDMLDGDFGYLKTKKNFSISYIKERYDYIVTYHYDEAKKYGLQFYELPYTRLNFEESNSIIYDLFFVGNAKNRLNEIHQLYLEATKVGLKCGFWVNNVCEEEKLQGTNIFYNQRLSYMEYLKAMLQSKCIVELCQKNDRTTLRYYEAVTYNKKLLTDDATCIHKSLFNRRFIKLWNGFVNNDILNWILEDDVVDYGYVNEFSPLGFIEFIENLE